MKCSALTFFVWGWHFVAGGSSLRTPDVNRALQQTTYEWSDYVTDNHDDTVGMVTCEDTANSLVSGIGCTGSYCDNVRLYCQTGGADGSSSYSESTSYWTVEISEETEHVMCKEDYFMNGLSCTGHFCDNVAMHCTYSEGRIAGDCSWTDWVSEEGTGMITFTEVDSHVRGMECRGSYCDDKRFLVCPAIDTTSTPTEAPSVAPTYLSGTPTCQPTSGVCASTASELQALIDEVEGQSTVSICNGATIDTSLGAVTASAAAGLILCCAGTNCVMESDGSDRNLDVIGDSFTVRNIDFLGGGAAGDAADSAWENGGGNARIRVANDLQIVDCKFIGGDALKSGGNLYVDYTGDNGSVTVQGSSFSGGNVTSSYGHGGGAYFEGANAISISGCDFNGNTARWAGGVDFSTAIGQMPSLEILNTSFNENSGTSVMIDSATWIYEATLAVALYGNSGAGTFQSSFEIGQGPDDCADIYIRGDRFSPECVPIGDEYNNDHHYQNSFVPSDIPSSSIAPMTSITPSTVPMSPSMTPSVDSTFVAYGTPCDYFQTHARYASISPTLVFDLYDTVYEASPTDPDTILIEPFPEQYRESASLRPNIYPRKFLGNDDDSVDGSHTQTRCLNYSPLGLDLDGSGAVERIAGDFELELPSRGFFNPLPQQYIQFNKWFAPTEGILVAKHGTDWQYHHEHYSPIGIQTNHQEWSIGNMWTIYMRAYVKDFDEHWITADELQYFAVWQDLNSNLRIDEGELGSLESHGIVSIYDPIFWRGDDDDAVKEVTFYLSNNSTMFYEDL